MDAVGGALAASTAAPDSGFPAEGRPFAPPFWLRNPHANTVYSFLRPRFVRLPPAQADWIPVEPGVDILVRSHWQPGSAPLLVLVHGLEGSSEAGYMLTTAALALARGWHVARMNVRGCGESESRCATLYNSGKSGDVARVLEWAASLPLVTAVALAGFSMGGNLVLKCAGELSRRDPGAGAAANAPPLAAVAAVSPCLDLAACADALHRPVNYFYERRFLRNLQQRLRRHALRFPERGYPVEKLDTMRSVREFDDAVTAPFTGYRNADDYYARASAALLLSDIRVPTLVLHAEDDPFIVITPPSRRVLAANPWIRFLNPPHGGHCAFIASRRRAGAIYWAESRLVAFCSAALPARGGRAVRPAGEAGAKSPRNSELRTAPGRVAAPPPSAGRPGCEPARHHAPDSRPGSGGRSFVDKC